MRAFIAIEIPPKIKAELSSLSNQLHSNLVGQSIRWLPIENIHLTLKFFKELPRKDIDLVSTIMRELMAEYLPFNLKLNELGVFPHPNRPQVIWLGIKQHSRLYKLQEDLSEELVKLAYPAERRTFSPHLTLGRLRRNVPSSDFAQINQAVQNVIVDASCVFTVKEALLFRSELSANGAKYTKLFGAKLGNAKRSP